MGRLGRWCIRMRIPHISARMLNIHLYFLDVSGGILFGKLYVCEYRCDSRVGSGRSVLSLIVMCLR
jgi:hypothetical protein